MAVKKTDELERDYSVGADASLMSDEDYAAVRSYGDQYNAAREAGNQAGMQAAHDAAEALRAKYSYSGGGDGSQYIKLPQDLGSQDFSYESAPSYVSKYQSQIDQLASQILNREKFSYDPETDPLYQQYADSYTRNGQRAMQDTLGQLSARTGGLASSYAGTASQQTYDNYMAALADKIPELRQLAYSMYQDEGDTQRANLEMLMALDQGDYAKYADLLGQYNTDRSFDYGVFADDRSFDYGLSRDAVEDARYADETSWNRQTYQDETAYSRSLQKAQTLAAAGDFSGYKALGYTDGEIANMKASYDAAQMLAAKSGGSGGSGTSGSSSSKPALTAAQTLAALKDGVINDTTLAAYRYYYGEDYAGAEGDIAGDSSLSETGQNLYYQLQRIPGLTGENKVAMIEDALNNGRITEQDAEWLLDYLGY